MPAFSVCILARDGGLPLKETLQSCRGRFDEILTAVPSGNTVAAELARRYTPHVVDYIPEDGPCTALQRSFEKATGDYRFGLMEGDMFTPSETGKLRALRRALHAGISGIRVRYEKTAGAPDISPYYLYEIRAAARDAACIWEDDANPILHVSGNISTFDLTITRQLDTPENFASGLSWYQKLAGQIQTLSPRAQLYYARAQRDSGQAAEAVKTYGALLHSSDAPDELRAAACLELAACQTDTEQRMDTLLYSLRFQKPQADICCGIGDYLLQQNRFSEAAHWYTQALAQKPPVSSRPIYTDYYRYVPALQLCRCCYALGEPQKAEQYNRLAGEFRPGDESVHSNESFFATRRAGKK